MQLMEGIATRCVTECGEYVIVSPDIPRIRSVMRTRRIAFVIGTTEFSEYSTEKLPDARYNRGSDDDDPIPETWDGVTFRCKFGLGGPDMEGMKDFITLMRDGTRIVSYDTDVYLNRSAIADRSAGADWIVPIDNFDPSLNRCAHIICDDIVRRKDVPNVRRATLMYPDGSVRNGKPYVIPTERYMASRQVPPYVVSELVVPQEGNKIIIHSELYDGGTLSHTDFVPSASTDVTVTQRRTAPLIGTEIARASENTRVEWSYTVSMHVGRQFPTARYVQTPTNKVMKATYEVARRCLMHTVDFVDYATHTKVA